jgi:hypothetical protein
MIGRETRFEDTCEITGVKNDVSVIGEILEFKHRDVIVATINRAAKVTLRWKEPLALYVGSLGGVEFHSPGPKAHTVQTHR